MPAEYRLTSSAEHDLEEIIDYTLEHWGTMQASDYVDGFEALAQALAENPLLGTANILDYENLYTFPYESHILFYVKKSFGISIVRILHQSMLPENHL